MPAQADEFADISSKLLVKIQQATRGSRALDVAIYVHENPMPCVPMSRAAQDRFDHQKAPHYTTSIDDALLLVPKDLLRVLMVTFSSPAKAGGHDGIKYVYFEGATPALAICVTAYQYRLHPDHRK